MRFYRIFFICLIFVSTQIFAQNYPVQIYDIDIPGKADEDILVFLSDGKVAKISSSQEELFRQIQRVKEKNSWIIVSLDKNRTIVQVAPSSKPMSDNKEFVTVDSFIDPKPTVIKSMASAEILFKESRFKKGKHSQCFNRAHVWAYEWKTNKKISSSKMFIFFSRKYIRETNFHWWFHVAPYLHVVVGNQIKERIMDMKYTRGPTSMKGWKDSFMKVKATCATVAKYSEYANYPESGSCYVMRTSMYTYWPLDLEMEELNGTKKTSWVKEELDIAYSDSLDITI